MVTGKSIDDAKSFVMSVCVSKKLARAVRAKALRTGESHSRILRSLFADASVTALLDSETDAADRIALPTQRSLEFARHARR